ncbi:MAG: enoyl-CoA hydratase/isomerase family protein [Chitinophagaceae bacterium]|nr:enoyl-CoA hydratase/isomerase family protein [Polaromonas sp.]
MSGSVDLTLRGPVAHVSLSHPGKLNAMSRSMWCELQRVFVAIQNDQQLRCVVVEGEGGHFCSGGDISEYPAFRFDEVSLRAFHEGDVWGGLSAMLACDVPIVAHIEGNCMGAGLEIASCCDLRLASNCARFGAPIAKLGFPMAPREAALVMHAVGEQTARDMLLTAAVLDAGAMQQRGFLNSVQSAGDTTLAVQACMSRITALAPHAARLNKQMFRSVAGVFSSSVATQSIANTTFNVYGYAASHEHREGVAAFIEKRSPTFNRFN